MEETAILGLHFKLGVCQASITAGSSEMSGLIHSSQELLGAAPAAEAWLAFVGDASAVVVEGLTEMLKASLRYLLSQVRILPLEQQRNESVFRQQV